MSVKDFYTSLVLSDESEVSDDDCLETEVDN